MQGVGNIRYLYVLFTIIIPLGRYVFKCLSSCVHIIYALVLHRLTVHTYEYNIDQ